MRRQAKTIFSITMVIITTIVFHYVGFLDPIERAAQHLITPGSKIVYEWGVELGGEIETFTSVTQLEDAYVQLKKMYTAALVEKGKSEMLEQENRSLREQLNFFKTHDIEHIGAEVIGKNIDPIGSSIIIDQGSRSGVSIGNPVIVEDGVFVGKIARTEEDFSIVRLISDTQSKIASTLLNYDKSIGLVEGGYGISVRMSFIPQNEEIQIGDIVMTSGLEEGVPYGLLIGTIESVEKELYQPFQRAIVQSPINLEKIRVVSVLVDKNI